MMMKTNLNLHLTTISNNHLKKPQEKSKGSIHQKKKKKELKRNLWRKNQWKRERFKFQ